MDLDEMDSAAKQEVDKIRAKSKRTYFPLMDTPVIRNLFKYLRLQDLVAARAVCRLWHELATPKVEDRADEFLVNLSHPTKWKNRLMIKFYLEMKKKSDLIFSNFRLGGKAPLDKGLEFKALLSSFQETLTKLELDFEADAENVITPAVFRDILVNKSPFLERLVLKTLPSKLKRQKIFNTAEFVQLELRSLSLHLFYRSSRFSDAFLEDIFKASQKLEELSIHSNYDSECTERKLMELFVEYGRPQQLTKLDLEHLTDSIIQILCNQLQSAALEIFRVESVDVTESALELEMFLNTHQNTLTELSLWFCDFNSTYGDQNETLIELPVMKNLKILKLGLYIQNFGEVDYGKLFPKLEVLKITEKCAFRDSTPGRRNLIDAALFTPNSSVCPNVMELELPENLESASVLQNIARIFPNVLKLNLEAQQGEVLEALWDCWPNVDRLAVSLIIAHPEKKQYPRNLDSIFTGFSETMIGQLKKKLVKGKHLEVDNLERYRQMSSIVNLKNLKHLIIHGGPNLNRFTGDVDAKVRFTDVTLSTALAFMKNLIYVTIDAGTHKFTQAGVDNLATELQLQKIEHSSYFESLLFCELVKYDWQKPLESSFFYWPKI